MNKTKYATIVNIGNESKPYYVIRYKRIHDDFESEGYGSCYYYMVLEWLREYFEIIPEN